MSTLSVPAHLRRLNSDEVDILTFFLVWTVFSKPFGKLKKVYYCQVFTIYHVIYVMICQFGKRQKVYQQKKFTISGLLSPGSTLAVFHF